MKKIDDLLMNAIVNNDLQLLNTLEYDINYQFVDEDNDSLLMYSISDPQSSAYNFFLKRGASIRIVNNEGENILHSIVYSGQIDRLDLIRSLFPKEINHMLNDQTNDGITPLLLSVLLNKRQIFSRLIEMGANVNIPDDENNLPIHIACSLGYTEMVHVLVQNYSHIHKKTNKGNYPLALAINGDHTDIIIYLFKVLYKDC